MLRLDKFFSVINNKFAFHKHIFRYNNNNFRKYFTQEEKTELLINHGHTYLQIKYIFLKPIIFLLKHTYFPELKISLE